MKIVVVGGHSRNIGKTGVMAGLIRASRSVGWTAVKITQFGHGVCSEDGEPCECAPEVHPFELTEERDPRGRADTCRFLRAGARRSLWLRVREGQLPEAFPGLQKSLNGADFVMIESNSVLGLLNPDLYLFVLESSRPDFKDSARRFLERADALVPIGGPLGRIAWPGLDPRVFQTKPVFPISSPDYSSPELAQFLIEKLSLPCAT